MRLSHRPSDILDNRRAQEKINQVGVELSTSAVRDDPHRGLECARVTVWPRLRHCIERIGDRNDARFDRDGFALEFTRIPRAIPPLVVRENSLGQIRIERSQRLENFCAFPRMSHYGVALASREPLCVVHDIRDRAVDLADVVKEGDALHAALLALVEIGCARERERIVRDTPDMSAGLGVVGVDCVQEAFESRRSKPLESEPFPALAIEENACRRTD
jgi:hypothetical protein